jgi:hypothetical protein
MNRMRTAKRAELLHPDLVGLALFILSGGVIAALAAFACQSD